MGLTLAEAHVGTNYRQLAAAEAAYDRRTRCQGVSASSFPEKWLGSVEFDVGIFAVEIVSFAIRVVLRFVRFHNNKNLVFGHYVFTFE